MNWDSIVAWFKGFWKKDVMSLIENEISGFTTMKNNFEKHLAEAETQFKASEAEVLKKKAELEEQMRKIEAKIQEEVSKQTVLNAAKAKATTIIGNIESFMNEKLSTEKAA